jgi:hypothetical protein
MRGDFQMAKIPSEAQLVFRRVPKAKLDAMAKCIGDSLRKRQEEEKLQEAERWKPKTEVIGTCRCKGKIVEVTTYGYYLGPSVAGGHRGISRPEEKECFCQSCGVMYNADIVKKRT